MGYTDTFWSTRQPVGSSNHPRNTWHSYETLVKYVNLGAETLKNRQLKWPCKWNVLTLFDGPDSQKGHQTTPGILDTLTKPLSNMWTWGMRCFRTGPQKELLQMRCTDTFRMPMNLLLLNSLAGLQEQRHFQCLFSCSYFLWVLVSLLLLAPPKSATWSTSHQWAWRGCGCLLPPLRLLPIMTRAKEGRYAKVKKRKNDTRKRHVTNIPLVFAARVTCSSWSPGREVELKNEEWREKIR